MAVVEDYDSIKKRLEALKDLQKMDSEDWKNKYKDKQDTNKKDTWRI